MGDAINSRPIPPKGVKKIARGWSEAETHGNQRRRSHPRGMGASDRSLASLQDADSFTLPPGVSASLQPLATFFCPSGAAAPLIRCNCSSTSGLAHTKNLAKKTRNYAFAKPRIDRCLGYSLRYLRVLCASAVSGLSAVYSASSPGECYLPYFYRCSY
jgi:hypothetical protein